MVAERLRGSIATTTRPMSDPLLLDQSVVEPGGQRCFEQCKRLLSLFLPWRRPTRADQMRATRRSVGSRNKSDRPGAWTEAWPGTGPTGNTTSSRDPRVFGLLAEAVHWRSSRTSCQFSQHVSGAAHRSGRAVYGPPRG
jgi:hypothetical protein